jgi:hypothetical protein
MVRPNSFHAVDAHIRATDADHVGRGPGARGIVFGGDEAVPRIDRGRDRRAEIDVAEPHHEILGIEYDTLDVVDAVEPVHAADELDIVGAPWRVVAHRFHVFVDRLVDRRVFPRQRQVDHAGRDFEIVEATEPLLGLGKRIEQRSLG